MSMFAIQYKSGFQEYTTILEAVSLEEAASKFWQWNPKTKGVSLPRIVSVSTDKYDKHIGHHWVKVPKNQWQRILYRHN